MTPDTQRATELEPEVRKLIAATDRLSRQLDLFKKVLKAALSPTCARCGKKMGTAWWGNDPDLIVCSDCILADYKARGSA